MQKKTLQKTLSGSAKKSRQTTGEEPRRSARQSAQSDGARATYTSLPTKEKAEYVRDLTDRYYRSQRAAETAAKRAESAVRSGGAGSSTHYGSSGRLHGGSSGSFGEPSLYERRQQQKADARREILRRSFDLLGTAAVQSQSAASGYYASPSQQLALARRQADNVQAIKEANARFNEANRVIDWDGRSALASELEDLDRNAGWEISEEQANAAERRRQLLLEKLRAGDLAAGNGIRSGTDADTGRDIVESTAKGIGGASVDLFSNIGKHLERMDTYSWKATDTFSDLWNGQPLGTSRRERIQAYEDPASQEKWKRIDAAADRLSGDSAAVLQRAKEGKSFLGEIGVDAAKSALEMGFDSGVALATGGSALIPMGARVYGQSVGKARRAGANLDQQTAYALTSTAIELASEKLFDGVAGIYGAGAADDITEALVRRLADSDTGRTLLRAVIGSVGEGTEEIVSDLLDPLAEAMVRDESVGELYRQLDPADILYDYLIGSTIGLFGSGAGIAAGRNAEANRALKELDANEAAYLRRMEEIGHLRPEGKENAALDGAAKGSRTRKTVSSIISDQTSGIREGMTEAERFAVLKDRTVRVVSDMKSAAEKESLDRLSLIPRARTKAEKVLIPLAEKLGILNRDMRTPEVDIEFQFSKNKGLKESTNKQLRYGGDYVDFAKALINIDEILENAVLIEKHGDKYRDTARENSFLKDVSVLFGAFSDGRSVIPVQFEIKNTSDYGGKLYMVVSLSKIEADVLERTSSKSGTTPSLVSASEYKIAELFRKVNPRDKHFLKYLPDEMLTEEQRAAKEEALEEDRKRIASYAKKMDRS